ncbi:hypothetical protein DFJ58DRAFT_842858 [Suillus subalutaceus]|uniref:uncharacterized protein n=1 Tax=Suillus subalutaceus TaxID=48586 RepID=UPI001B8701E8|nr:uncharacterized protein DFJ58DRAFT_842858 [Suillus subalutaceus]KAG1848761.1 hypothetical protein DFJ58DRAFT_842858 [Suillus subalutaceus]
MGNEEHTAAKPAHGHKMSQSVLFMPRPQTRLRYSSNIWSKGINKRAGWRWREWYGYSRRWLLQCITMCGVCTVDATIAAHVPAPLVRQQLHCVSADVRVASGSTSILVDELANLSVTEQEILHLLAEGRGMTQYGGYWGAGVLAEAVDGCL